MDFVKYDQVERTLEPVMVTGTAKTFVKYDEAEGMLEPVIRISENLCAFYFSKQTPTVFLNDNPLAKIAPGERLIKHDHKKLS